MMSSAARQLALAAALAVAAAPLAADTVHLANGRSFDGVEARVEGDRVWIRFDYGEMAVPRATVARIDSETSALTVFEARWRSLALAEASGEEWLGLARWAAAQGLDHGAARAAERAALLDPELEGLAGFLGSLGFARDEATGAWMPVDELMAQRGWVRDGSGWIPPEQAASRRAAAQREQAARQAAQREDRILRAMEVLALARVAEETAPEPATAGIPLYPVVAVPGVPYRHHGRGGGWADTPANRRTWQDLTHRNPGSLLPVGPYRPTRSPGSNQQVEPGRSHHGGFADGGD
ncbi:MAG: hypothetical protein R2991_09890 [Thermoanaerobaculia bacterium]